MENVERAREGEEKKEGIMRYVHLETAAAQHFPMYPDGHLFVI